MEDSALLTASIFIDPEFAQKMAAILDAANVPLQEFIDNIQKKAVKGLETFNDTIPVTEEELKKLTDQVKATTKGTTDYFMATQNLSNAQKANKQIVEGITSTYKSFSIENEKLRQTAKDLAIQLGTTSKEAIAATKAFNDHNNKLIAVDRSMNNFTRTIGDYTGKTAGLKTETQELIRGMGGLVGIAGAAMEMFGLEGESLERVRRISNEMIRTSREFSYEKNLDKLAVQEGIEAKEADTVATEAQQAATIENTVATGEQIEANTALAESNEIAGASWVEGIGIIGGATAVIIGIIEVISQYKQSAADMKDYTKNSNEAFKDYVETLKKTRDLLNEIATLQHEQTVSEGEQLKAAMAFQESKAIYEKARVSALKAVEDENKNTEKPTRPGRTGDVNLDEQLKSEYNNDLANYQAYITAKQQINSTYDQYEAQAQKVYDLTTKKAQATEENDFKKAKERNAEAIDMAKNKENKVMALLYEERDKKEEIDESEVYSTEQKEYLKSQITEEYRYKIIEQKKEDEKKAEELLDKELKKTEEIYAKEVDALRKKFADEQKLADDFNKTLGEKEKGLAVEQAKNKLDADKNKMKGKGTRKQRKQVLQDEIDVEKEEFTEKEATLDEWKQGEQEKIRKAFPLAGDSLQGKTPKEQKEILRQTQEAANAQTQLDLYISQQKQTDLTTSKNKIGTLKKEFNDTELKEEIENAKKGLEELKKYLSERHKAIEENLKAKNDLLKQDADAQQQQFMAGRANNLAQIMRQSAQMTAAAQAQGRTLQNEESYIGLATQLLTLTSSLPHFFEGTANTGKGGLLDSKGGFLAVNHPEEAVITRERNKELPGMSKAWLDRDYMKMGMILLPKLSEEPMTQRGDSVVAEKIDELIGLEKNKKSVEHVYETETESVRIVTENGITRRITHSKPINRPYRPTL